jgi:hypothetical protein
MKETKTIKINAMIIRVWISTFKGRRPTYPSTRPMRKSRGSKTITNEFGKHDLELFLLCLCIKYSYFIN